MNAYVPYVAVILVFILVAWLLTNYLSFGYSYTPETQYICNYCQAPGYCEKHYDPLVESYPYGVREGMAYYVSSDPCMCCRNSYERRKREAARILHEQRSVSKITSEAQ